MGIHILNCGSRKNAKLVSIQNIKYILQLQSFLSTNNTKYIIYKYKYLLILPNKYNRPTKQGIFWHCTIVYHRRMKKQLAQANL